MATRLIVDTSADIKQYLKESFAFQDNLQEMKNWIWYTVKHLVSADSQCTFTWRGYHWCPAWGRQPVAMGEWTHGGNCWAAVVNVVESSPTGQRVKGDLCPLQPATMHKESKPQKMLCLPPVYLWGMEEDGQRAQIRPTLGCCCQAGWHSRLRSDLSFAAGGVRIIPIVLAITKNLVPLAAAFWYSVHALGVTAT